MVSCSLCVLIKRKTRNIDVSVCVKLRTYFKAELYIPLLTKCQTHCTITTSSMLLVSVCRSKPCRVHTNLVFIFCIFYDSTIYMSWRQSSSFHVTFIRIYTGWSRLVWSHSVVGLGGLTYLQTKAHLRWSQLCPHQSFGGQVIKIQKPKQNAHPYLKLHSNSNVFRLPKSLHNFYLYVSAKFLQDESNIELTLLCLLFSSLL